MQTKYYPLWEASKFLQNHLHGTAKQWYGFLNRNVRQSQNGYRITTHIIDGKPTFTESALREFVRVNQPVINNRRH